MKMRDEAMAGIPGSVADAVDEMLAVIGAGEIASLQIIPDDDLEAQANSVLVVTQLGVARFDVTYGQLVSMGRRQFEVTGTLVPWATRAQLTVHLGGRGYTNTEGHVWLAELSWEGLTVKRTDANAQAFDAFAREAYAAGERRGPPTTSA